MLLAHRRRALGSAVLAAAALALAGCSWTATGGGQLPGYNSPTATFGFSAIYKQMSSSSSSTAASGTCTTDSGTKTCSHVSGTYKDAPVSLRFTGGANGPIEPGCNVIVFSYTSTNPSQPGSGDGYATVCDSGSGGSIKGDTFSITLCSGPWAGYYNSGTVTNGNITVKNS